MVAVTVAVKRPGGSDPPGRFGCSQEGRQGRIEPPTFRFSAQSWEKTRQLPPGAGGFLLKDASLRLVAAIRVVPAGYGQPAREIIRRVIEEYVPWRSTCPGPEGGDAGVGALRNLSERELDVLCLIARGLLNAGSPASSSSAKARSDPRDPHPGQTRAFAIRCKRQCCL
jgi:hypothetical protein